MLACHPILGNEPTRTGFIHLAIAYVIFNNDQLGLYHMTDIIGIFPIIKN